MWRLFVLCACILGCAETPPASGGDHVAALLLGEQHDAPDHPRLQRDWIERLAGQRELAAVALEMAEQGTSTAALPPSADETQVRATLRWQDDAWPWTRYGPVVMAAVRAGVPVLGANLPRPAMREAMAQADLDRALPPPALQAQRQAIREGHCGLLPEARIGAMTRVQIARDQAMAAVVRAALQPGKTVLLVAGSGHVDAELGVPRHLPPGLRSHSVQLPAVATGRDHCAELRQQMQRPSSAEGAGSVRRAP